MRVKRERCSEEEEGGREVERKSRGEVERRRAGRERSREEVEGGREVVRRMERKEGRGSEKDGEE